MITRWGARDSLGRFDFYESRVTVPTGMSKVALPLTTSAFLRPALPRAVRFHPTAVAAHSTPRLVLLPRALLPARPAPHPPAQWSVESPALRPDRFPPALAVWAPGSSSPPTSPASPRWDLHPSPAA